MKQQEKAGRKKVRKHRSKDDLRGIPRDSVEHVGEDR